jgi:hypothetical protein
LRCVLPLLPPPHRCSPLPSRQQDVKREIKEELLDGHPFDLFLEPDSVGLLPSSWFLVEAGATLCVELKSVSRSPSWILPHPHSEDIPSASRVRSGTFDERGGGQINSSEGLRRAGQSPTGTFVFSFTSLARSEPDFSSFFSQPFPLRLPPFSLPSPPTRRTPPPAAPLLSPLRLPSLLPSLPLLPVTLLDREAGSRMATRLPSPTFSHPAVVLHLRLMRRARRWTSNALSPTRRRPATLSLSPSLLFRPLATPVATTCHSQLEVARGVVAGVRMSRGSRRR